jgi:hypothetical protein
MATMYALLKFRTDNYESIASLFCFVSSVLDQIFSLNGFRVVGALQRLRNNLSKYILL